MRPIESPPRLRRRDFTERIIFPVDTNRDVINTMGKQMVNNWKCLSFDIINNADSSIDLVLKGNRNNEIQMFK